MKTKMKLKIVTDLLMSAVLLLLMAYEQIGGQAAHEWIGMGMFALFILHHILNGKWIKNLFRGKYMAVRVMQTVLAALVLISMLGTLVSGIILSRYVFSFLPIHGKGAFGRILHMLSAYWGFVFMGLHLGFHWNMIMGRAGKVVKTSSGARKWVIRTIAALIVGYGVYAFIKREIGSYMFLKSHFVFFDFEEPVALFLLDYMAAEAVFVCAGHYFGTFLRGSFHQARRNQAQRR